MDSEIITLLSEIKFAVYALIAVVVVGVVGNWVRAGVSLKGLINRQLDDAFSEEASEYYDIR